MRLAVRGLSIHFSGVAVAANRSWRVGRHEIIGLTDVQLQRVSLIPGAPGSGC
jgi:hypothetical protein